MSPGQRGRGDRRGLIVRLRRWLLGTALVLVALLAGFIGYARHRARKALLDLPHLLGADIRSETNGFTYSQSVKGRTLFTIHAAKAIQRNNGKVTLHDVQVTVYGEPGSNRVDSIRGAEFEYDQPNGVVRSVGETQLDLASPVGATAASAASTRRIAVKATGLVFLEKLGVAATEGPIHFDYGTMSGDARGADYDSDTGVLQLRHDVHLLSRENGHVELVDADSANIDRIARTILLQQALLRDAGDVLRAQVLHVQLRPENAKEAGPIQEAHAEGGVQLTNSEGVKVNAPTMIANWGTDSRPREVRMLGGVQMQSSGQEEGSAEEALLSMTVQGHPSRVTLLRKVRISAAGNGQAARVLTANEVVANFTAANRPVLRDLVASGAARLVSTETQGSKPSTVSTLTANTLHAFVNAIGKQWQIQRVEGEGATRIQQTDSTGLIRTSSGDGLTAVFQAGEGKAQPASGQRQQDFSGLALASVVQQGHVVMEELRPAVPATVTAPSKAAQKSRAVADRAEYAASTGRTLLTGSPQLKGNEFQVAADTVTVERSSGNAEAQGNVRGTYLSGSGNEPAGSNAGEPVHFLAAHTTFDQAGQRAVLYGSGSAARLWSSSGQIEAPVIELEQKTGRLLAHGASEGSAMLPVRTVLPSAQANPTPGKADAGPAGSGRDTGPMRIASRSLVYAQGTDKNPGTVQFLGEVRVDGPAGQVIADSATAELRPASGTNTGPMSDAVQKIIAEGHVRVLQPGRSGTGDRLLYTTADRQFVLTGYGGNLPTVRDTSRGVVTGTRLIFHAGDDSVEVAGAAGQPVHNDVVVPTRKGPVRPAERGRAQGGRAAGPKQ